MNKYLFIIADYLKGKSIYSPVRRILNLLFNISIASFIYEKTYGKYTWLNYDNYKGILDFFIKGKFFIPFSIFFAVYSLTQILSVILFTSINHFKTLKWTKEIIAYEVRNDLIEERLNTISEVSKYVSPIVITKPLLIELYNNLKSDLTVEMYNKIENELREPKENLEATFHLFLRGLIAISIYFLSLSQFGWVLFIIILLTLLVGMYLILLAYRFLDILPALVRKLHTETEKYILRYFSNPDNS